ncbi:MAG: adenine phosphoribosyltransferase [Succinivibrio sp.]|nr:adenine phosphoribosyltransferase [Succinivibrio sp.]
MAADKSISDFERDVEFIKSTVKTIPDYPKPGIMFRDVTSLCTDRRAFGLTISLLKKVYIDKSIDKVVSAEARGFVFGAPLAAALGAGFVMVRKPGKLPRKTIEESYELEYGTNKLQIHADSFKTGERVLLLDDLLATGGTMDAMVRMVQRLGAEVAGCAFVIELEGLPGRKLLEDKYGIDVYSLVTFPDH